MDIHFTTKLNDLGHKLISDLYETNSWLEVCKLNTDLHPSILAGVNDNLNVIPFSGPSSKTMPPSGYDKETQVWTVNNMFKWKGPVDDVMVRILEHIIAEPMTVSIYHDLWEKKRTIDIKPKEEE